MAYTITDGCIGCGSCAAGCPADAISMGDVHYEINQDSCILCGSCAAACPMEAIIEE